LLLVDSQRSSDRDLGIITFPLSRRSFSINRSLGADAARRRFGRTSPRRCLEASRVVEEGDPPAFGTTSTFAFAATSHSIPLYGGTPIGNPSEGSNRNSKNRTLPKMLSHRADERSTRRQKCRKRRPVSLSVERQPRFR
jgi:hypothetical protein